jgi:lipoprotein NlpD
MEKTTMKIMQTNAFCQVKHFFIFGFLSTFILACQSSSPAQVDDLWSSHSPYIFYPLPKKETLSASQSKDHRVKKGETLFSIASLYSIDYHQIMSNNALKSLTIYPEQTLRIYPQRIAIHQKTLIKTASNVLLKPLKTHPKKAHKKLLRTSKKPISASKNKKPHPTPSIHSVNTLSISKNIPSFSKKNRSITQWIWPIKGKILQPFSNKAHKNKGVDIKGKLGSLVKASAAGRVVYSGHGLRGYGQLIIIKHNSDYLTAYAYNNKRHVLENEIVKAGQIIAELSQHDNKYTKLHFEIRYKGRPVNPLHYLPQEA